MLISRSNAFLQGENAQILKLLNYCSIWFEKFPKRNFLIFLETRSYKTCSFKKNFWTLKIFILGEKCLSVAKRKFLQPENFQNFKLSNLFWIWSWNYHNEIISYFCTREVIKTFSLKRIFQLLKIWNF